jgi:carbon-monoxide dehydrogenase medium subunit
MREFDYLEPTSVEEASRLLAELGEDARVIAGGTALMLGMRQRMLAPTHLISVAKIERLRGIGFDPQHGLRIGALTRHSDVARSPLVRQHVPVLASMAERVANPQVRNQGTIGGNLCYADPSTDPPGCLLALDAQVVLGSARGERVLSIDEFLIDYYATALAGDEIVVELRVPPLAQGTVGLYTRYLRTAAEHRPLVSVAFVARREGQRCHAPRLVVGASTPIPTRVPRAEALLDGQTLTPAIVQQAADIVAEDITLVDDLRGSADFRRAMVRVNARRTIAALFGLPTDEGVLA